MRDASRIPNTFQNAAGSVIMFLLGLFGPRVHGNDEGANHYDHIP